MAIRTMAFSNPSEVVRQLGLAPGAVVADLGAGSGFYTFALSKSVGLDGKVYAVEILPDLAKRIASHAAIANIKNVSVLSGDVEQQNGTGLPDGRMDAVIAANLFFQLEERGKALVEISRILRPGGQLLMVDWSDSFAGMGPQPEQVFPKESAKKLAESRGFVLVRDVQAGSHHWGVLFRKPAA